MCGAYCWQLSDNNACRTFPQKPNSKISSNLKAEPHDTTADKSRIYKSRFTGFRETLLADHVRKLSRAHRVKLFR